MGLVSSAVNTNNSGGLLSPGYVGALSQTGSTQNVLPYLQPYSNSGNLSDTNLGESSALGFSQATNTGNVSATPEINYEEQIEQSQLTQAQQQQGQQSESQTQGLLTQGAQAVNNANTATNIGSQISGALGSTSLASSGFAGVGTTGTIGTSGAITGAGGVGSAVDFGTGTAGAVTGEGGVGAGVDWGTGAANAGVAGSTPTWAAAGSYLGYAGAGYFGGGLLAGALGENAEGGSIGGAAGAVAGGFAGAATLGAALGSAAGPVGALAGGIIGATVGGLFGNNKPSDSTQVGGINLGTGQINSAYANQESDTGSKFNQANANTRNTAQLGAANLAQWLQANGATPMNAQNAAQTNLVIKVGSRDGYQIGTQGPNGLNYSTTLPSSTSQTGLNDAVSQSVLSQYNLTPALQNQIKTINSGSFFNTNFNLQNALSNPSSLTGQIDTVGFATPSVNSANSNGRGILQVPENGQSDNAQSTTT